jgi:hypothetical protein
MKGKKHLFQSDPESLDDSIATSSWIPDQYPARRGSKKKKKKQKTKRKRKDKKKNTKRKNRHRNVTRKKTKYRMRGGSMQANPGLVVLPPKGLAGGPAPVGEAADQGDWVAQVYQYIVKLYELGFEVELMRHGFSCANLVQMSNENLEGCSKIHPRRYKAHTGYPNPELTASAKDASMNCGSDLVDVQNHDPANSILCCSVLRRTKETAIGVACGIQIATDGLELENEIRIWRLPYLREHDGIWPQTKDNSVPRGTTFAQKEEKTHSEYLPGIDPLVTVDNTIFQSAFEEYEKARGKSSLHHDYANEDPNLPNVLRLLCDHAVRMRAEHVKIWGPLKQGDTHHKLILVTHSKFLSSIQKQIKGGRKTQHDREFMLVEVPEIGEVVKKQKTHLSKDGKFSSYGSSPDMLLGPKKFNNNDVYTLEAPPPTETGKILLLLTNIYRGETKEDEAITQIQRWKDADQSRGIFGKGNLPDVGCHRWSDQSEGRAAAQMGAEPEPEEVDWDDVVASFNQRTLVPRAAARPVSRQRFAIPV